jgi:hypothetical protein
MSNNSTVKHSTLVNSIIAIVLILFTSLIAPKLPKSIAKWLDDPLIRFCVFTGIAYLATRNVVLAIILSIAVIGAYQTLNMHKITDTILNNTKKMINNQHNHTDNQNMASDNHTMHSDNHTMHSDNHTMHSDNHTMHSDNHTMHSNNHKPNINNENILYEQTNNTQMNNDELTNIINNIAIKILNKDNMNQVISSIVAANPNIDSTLISNIVHNLYNNIMNKPDLPAVTEIIIQNNKEPSGIHENDKEPSGIPENEFDLNGPVDFNNNILSDSCFNINNEYNKEKVCQQNIYNFEGYEADHYMQY